MTDRPTKPNPGMITFGSIEEALGDVTEILEGFLDLCEEYKEKGYGFPVDRDENYRYL